MRSRWAEGRALGGGVVGRRRGAAEAAVVAVVGAMGWVTACGSEPVGSAPSAGAGGASDAGWGEGGAAGSGSGSGSGGGCEETLLGCPPEPPPPAFGETETVVAFSKLHLGLAHRSGEYGPTTAWGEYGFDLDGLISASTDTNHCRLRENALPAAVQRDAPGGIDNGFGANLVPLLLSVFPDPQGAVDRAIDEGRSTMLLRFANLGDPTVDQSGVTTLVYRAADRGAPPAWTGADVWPVAWESVQGGDVGRPLAPFPGGLLVGGALAARGSAVELVLDLGGARLVLPLKHAVLALEVAGTGADAVVSAGNLGGVVETEQLVQAARAAFAAVLPEACDEAEWSWIEEQLRGASDLRADGTNGDPTKDCDAVSVGLGFEARAARLGAVAPPAVAAGPPCDAAAP
ncbi:MAG: hypothetical protein IT376_20725 [Polyangiaceae bacterium]|nr:hypothetical protein [Polyangiaceae bacterium]